VLVTRRWKLAAIGILTVAATSLASTLTTTYLMRPPAPTAPVVEPEPPAVPEARPPIVRVAPPRRGSGATRRIGATRKTPTVTQPDSPGEAAP
jgi:hypothetical protein